MQTKLLFLFFAALFAFGQANAELQMNGFASIVSGIDLEDDGASDYGSRTVDNLQESKVALQWSADLGEGMRFVGQTMARGSATDGFNLSYDWAYFDVNVGDSSKLKFGRLRIPFYKYSDYLDVGYAYHWITPPRSMYSIFFSNLDGVGFQTNFSALGMDHSLNTTLGSFQQEIVFNGEDVQTKFENFLAINWSATMGNHEFNAAFSRSDGYIPAQAFVGIATLATLVGADGNDVLYNGDTGSFIGVGYKGTFGDISIFSEYSSVTIDNAIIGDFSGGYLGASYNMGDYTYHLTYGVRKDDEKVYSGSAGPLTPDTDLVFADATLSGSSINSLARSFGNGDSTTITLGTRKEIGATTALKVEIDFYTEDKVQDALITSVSEERKATVLKFAIETMF